MHALIVGARGVGKSTLIRRVLSELNRPVFGFETKKEDSLAEELRGSPVYIYDAGKERVRTEANLVGYCRNKCFGSMKSAFDSYAPKLRREIPDGSVVLLDELGFMESLSEEFCSSVMALLDGDVPVIAAVKDKNTDFLCAVRAHPNCRCFCITEENREELFAEVLEFLRSQAYFNGEEK